MVLLAALGDVVNDCVDFLDKCAEAEFLFRAPGRKEVVDSLVSRYERGERGVALEPAVGAEANDVASLLKRYLTESRERIFSRAQVNSLLKWASKVESGDSARARKSMDRFDKSLVSIVGAVPQPRASILAGVLKLLGRVAQAERSSKMPAYALAVCLAPSLVLSALPDREVPAKVKTAIVVVQALIERGDNLFQQSSKTSRRISIPRLTRQKSQFTLEHSIVASRAPVDADPGAGLKRRSTGTRLSWLQGLELYRSSECQELRRSVRSPGSLPASPRSEALEPALSP